MLQYLFLAGQAGLKAVDGAIIDRTIRAGIDLGAWSESGLLVLNGCYQPNSFMRLHPDFRLVKIADADASSKLEARRKYGLPEQGFLISNMSNFNRITEETLLSWFRILVGIQGSYLVLLDHGELANSRIEKLAQANGCAGR